MRHQNADCQDHFLFGISGRVCALIVIVLCLQIAATAQDNWTKVLDLTPGGYFSAYGQTWVMQKPPNPAGLGWEASIDEGKSWSDWPVSEWGVSKNTFWGWDGKQLQISQDGITWNPTSSPCTANYYFPISVVSNSDFVLVFCKYGGPSNTNPPATEPREVFQAGSFQGPWTHIATVSFTDVPLTYQRGGDSIFIIDSSKIAYVTNGGANNSNKRIVVVHLDSWSIEEVMPAGPWQRLCVNGSDWYVLDGTSGGIPAADSWGKHGIMISHDGGKSWNFSGLPQYLWAPGTNYGNIFSNGLGPIALTTACTESSVSVAWSKGLMISFDKGNTWSNYSSGLTGPIYSYAVPNAFAAKGFIYVQTNNAVFRRPLSPVISH